MSRYNPIKVIVSDRLHVASNSKTSIPFIDLAKSIYSIGTDKVDMFVNANSYNVVSAREVGDVVVLSLVEKHNGLEVVIKPTENIYPGYTNKGVYDAEW